MICLAYFSSAAAKFDGATLGALVEQSKRNNAGDGVTGLLCHYDGSFLQFLEGEPNDVDRVFRRISGDPRHRGVLEVYRRPIETRAFGDWSMAVVSPGEVGPAREAFCKGLREVAIDGAAKHAAGIEPFLISFQSWLR